MAFSLRLLAVPRWAAKLSTAAFSTGPRRPSRAVVARAADSGLEDMFSPNSSPLDEQEEVFARDMSKTAQRKRYDELRKLGREIVKLTPRMVERLSLSADLLDVVEEWGRVGGKRGSGSAKKGKARLEGLLAQQLLALPADEQKTLERTVRAMQSGTAVLSNPSKRQKAILAEDGDAAKTAGRWANDILRGEPAEEAQAMGEIFDAVELVREREWNGEGDGEESGGAGKKGPALDRAQLRQLTQRAQNEVAAAVAKASKAAAAAGARAAAASAAAAAVANAVAPAAVEAVPPLLAALAPAPAVAVSAAAGSSRRVGSLGPAERELIMQLTKLAEAVAPDADESGDEEAEGDDEEEEVDALEDGASPAGEGLDRARSDK